MSDKNDKTIGDDKKATKPRRSRTSNHSPSEEPAFNTVLEPDGSPKEKKKKTPTPKKEAQHTKGISRQSAVLLALMSTLAGGAIGWGGPLLFGNQSAKTDALQSTLDKTRSELAAAKTEQQKLADNIAAIQGTSKNQASSNQSIVVTLSDLEDKIIALQEAKAPVDNTEAIRALEDRISKLGTLNGVENEDGTTSVNLLDLVERLDTLEAGGSPEIAARLDTLETQIKEAGTQAIAFPKPDPTPIELPPAETAQSAEETLQVLINTFPRAKMLETVKAQEALAAKKPSWLQRALSRHVKTHDDDKINPIETIDAAEAALKLGEVNQSLRYISTLNPPVRAVAAEWIDAAKKASKLIEKDL